MGRLSRRNKYHLIQVECIPSRFCRDEVTVMDWIERASHKPYGSTPFNHCDPNSTWFAAIPLFCSSCLIFFFGGQIIIAKEEQSIAHPYRCVVCHFGPAQRLDDAATAQVLHKIVLRIGVAPERH